RPSSVCYSYFLHSYARPRHLHSFPTRRSSDLAASPPSASSSSSPWPTSSSTGFSTSSVPAAWATPLVRGTQVGPQARLDLRDSLDRKSTRLNSSHGSISYAVFCLKKKKI